MDPFSILVCLSSFWKTLCIFNLRVYFASDLSLANLCTSQNNNRIHPLHMEIPCLLVSFMLFSLPCKLFNMNASSLSFQINGYTNTLVETLRIHVLSFSFFFFLFYAFYIIQRMQCVACVVWTWQMTCVDCVHMFFFLVGFTFLFSLLYILLFIHSFLIYFF
jgi:hypothetical protein